MKQNPAEVLKGTGVKVRRHPQGYRGVWSVDLGGSGARLAVNLTSGERRSECTGLAYGNYIGRESAQRAAVRLVESLREAAAGGEFGKHLSMSLRGAGAEFWLERT